MKVEIATEPGTAGRANEDFAAAGPGVVVLLDGAGTPAGAECGCEHGVAWFAAALGSGLLAEVVTRPDRALTDCLADAIVRTAALHGDGCDLAHPGTPSATVIAVRVTGEVLEYLVLADSVLLLEHTGGRAPVAVSDDRAGRVGVPLRGPVDALAAGTSEHTAALRSYVETLREHRNREDGFWVAAADPAAAYAALTGSVPLAELTGFTLLSDGASRLVDTFHRADWAQVAGLVRGEGPGSLIREVRACELTDPEGRRHPRGKARDDATVVAVTI
ncbi:protein phosphatase 2C domain-containing protein [Kitasatospora camelliae]|uniref:Protein phosphatase 2C domain-containing protein n=1 Tax=Kitasatospora camelliae TaxID=3156397 RepID=A0AAU8JZZ6_9ACTN